MQALQRYNQEPGLGSGVSMMNWGGSADVPRPVLPGMPMGAVAATTPGSASASAVPGGGSWWDGMLGKTNMNGTRTDGWGGLALGAASSLLNGWMGMQQYGLAKKQLSEGKRQFDMNWDAQKATTNSALEDRQRARVASNPGAYESIDSYMNRNGIK